jgi:hypothetical protein
MAYAVASQPGGGSQSAARRFAQRHVYALQSVPSGKRWTDEPTRFRVRTETPRCWQPSGEASRVSTKGWRQYSSCQYKRACIRLIICAVLIESMPALCSAGQQLARCAGGNHAGSGMRPVWNGRYANMLVNSCLWTPTQVNRSRACQHDYDKANLSSRERVLRTAATSLSVDSEVGSTRQHRYQHGRWACTRVRQAALLTAAIPTSTLVRHFHQRTSSGQQCCACFRSRVACLQLRCRAICEIGATALARRRIGASMHAVASCT